MKDAKWKKPPQQLVSMPQVRGERGGLRSDEGAVAEGVAAEDEVWRRNGRTWAFSSVQVREFRIAMPMEVPQFKVAQLFMLAKVQEELEAREKDAAEAGDAPGDGVEFLVNEPFDHTAVADPGVCDICGVARPRWKGQYTVKKVCERLARRGRGGAQIWGMVRGGVARGMRSTVWGSGSRPRSSRGCRRELSS
jgi:hypothetical protein